MVLSAFSVLSASVGFLISIPQLIGALNHTQNALEVKDVFINIAVDLGAVALFAFFFSRDWKAREQQLARLGREESLGALPIQLANGKRTSLKALRGFARVVLVAGTSQQVQAAVAAADKRREELQARGVIIVELPIYDAPGTSGSNSSSNSSNSEDLRWRASALQPAAWADWFNSQLKYSKKGGQTSGNGLFVGLRMDGRVRASGTGQPPWARFAAELAPIEGEGKWSGFFDGFDGRV